MVAVTYVSTIDYVAEMLGDDVSLFEAIIANDDTLTYGNIVNIYLGPGETTSALTNDGIEELNDMIRAARITPKTWHAFLEELVNDAELVTQMTTKQLLEQWSGYSQRREMAAKAVKHRGVSIALACQRCGVSETCYRYSPLFSDQNEMIADLLVRLNEACKMWGVWAVFPSSAQRKGGKARL